MFLLFEAVLVYRFLMESAASESRVILTCDRSFVSRNLSPQTFYVQGKDKKAQLAEVIAAFDLKISDSSLLSRCAKCNGKFVPRQAMTPLKTAFSNLPGIDTLYMRPCVQCVLPSDGAAFFLIYDDPLNDICV